MSESIVSILNSTTTLLNTRQIFTGGGEKCLQFKNIGINVIASASSSPDGFQIQFSSDNVHWDIIHKFSIKENEGTYFNFPVESEYFRIVYINGALNQTYFRLQTIMHTEMTKESTRRLNDEMSGENSAELTRSILTGLKPNKTFSCVNLDEYSNLVVSITGKNVDIFSEILLELKKLNLYMFQITNDKISEDDIDDMD